MTISSQSKSLNFDGTDDAVTIGTIHGVDDIVRFTNQFTLETWIYSTSQDADGQFRLLIGDPSVGGNGAVRPPSLYTYNRNKIHAGYGSGSSWNNIFPGPAFTTNKWNHIAYTYDGTNMVIYING